MANFWIITLAALSPRSGRRRPYFLVGAPLHTATPPAYPGLLALLSAVGGVGLYKLVEYAPHGDSPVGRISYDAAGHMSAMLLPPGREPVGQSAPADDFRAMMRGVVVYFGSYTIDEATGRVIHHVEAASNPAWIGDDFVRWYRFEGNRLTLSLNSEFQSTLVWERLPDVASE